MIVTLTQAIVNSGFVVPKGKKRIEVCDSVVRGLFIEVRSAANATPTWYLRSKEEGKTTYVRLGTTQELLLAHARNLALLRKAEHAAEARQAPETKTVQGDITLEDFMRDHYMPHAKNQKRSWLRDDQLYVSVYLSALLPDGQR